MQEEIITVVEIKQLPSCEEGACEICGHWDMMYKVAIYRRGNRTWEHYICDTCAEIIQERGKIKYSFSPLFVLENVGGSPEK